MFANLSARVFVHFFRALDLIALPKSSLAFFGTPNGIFINPKTPGITFSVLRKFEVIILLRKSKDRQRLSEQKQFTETIRSMLLRPSALQNY